MAISINLSKAKTIGHDIRRAKREEEFKPLDVQATIPMFAETAEAQRQEVREKYAVIQEQIDIATTPEEIKVALGIE
jgi:hypothetical protein